MAAVRDVLTRGETHPSAISAVMIGTTHFTNAFIEVRHLAPVGVLRLGAPATLSVRPFAGWPARLKSVVQGAAAVVSGGYNYDGRPIRPLDPNEIRAVVADFATRGLRAIAVSSVFAPVNREQEQAAAALVLEQLPDASITLSSDIGRIGLIERENAAIMNSALLGLADQVVRSFRRSFLLQALGIQAPYFIGRNDGTLLDPVTVARFPVATFASGPTNSMRGAAFLTGATDALVLDIGGTTADAGSIGQRLPARVFNRRRHERGTHQLSHAGYSVDRTGRGELVATENGRVRIGPQSVGYRITSEALIFGGKRLTASRHCRFGRLCRHGDRDRVRHLDKSFVSAAVDEIHRLAEDALDRMKTSGKPARVVLVGGGSVLINRELKGAASYGACASRRGQCHRRLYRASGGEVDRIFSYEATGREGALQQGATKPRRPRGGVPVPFPAACRSWTLKSCRCSTSREAPFACGSKRSVISPSEKMRENRSRTR